VQMLADMTLEELTDVEGIGEKTAETLLEGARGISNRIQREYLSKIRQEQAEADAEAQSEPGGRRKTGIESLFVSDAEMAEKSDSSEDEDSTDSSDTAESGENEEETASAD